MTKRLTQSEKHKAIQALSIGQRLIWLDELWTSGMENTPLVPVLPPPRLGKLTAIPDSVVPNPMDSNPQSVPSVGKEHLHVLRAIHQEMKECLTTLAQEAQWVQSLFQNHPQLETSIAHDLVQAPLDHERRAFIQRELQRRGGLTTMAKTHSTEVVNSAKRLADENATKLQTLEQGGASHGDMSKKDACAILGFCALVAMCAGQFWAAAGFLGSTLDC